MSDFRTPQDREADIGEAFNAVGVIPELARMGGSDMHWRHNYSNREQRDREIRQMPIAEDDGSIVLWLAFGVFVAVCVLAGLLTR